MKNMFYVYVLQSLSDTKKHYTGLTGDLQARLKKHNDGSVPHTSKHLPWEIRTATLFKDREKAADFERYLKSHSGRVFASRHF